MLRIWMLRRRYGVSLSGMLEVSRRKSPTDPVSIFEAELYFGGNRWQSIEVGLYSRKLIGPQNSECTTNLMTMFNENFEGTSIPHWLNVMGLASPLMLKPNAITISRIIQDPKSLDNSPLQSVIPRLYHLRLLHIYPISTKQIFA